MIVAALPLEPPEGDRCWAFLFVNDSEVAVESLVVESVDYEWGDIGHRTPLGTRFGRIAAGAAIELLKETDTEVRTSVTLRISGPEGQQRCVAEFGRLYRGRGPFVPIPVLNRLGKRATIEWR
jgi:hypothetical protein